MSKDRIPNASQQAIAGMSAAFEDARSEGASYFQAVEEAIGFGNWLKRNGKLTVDGKLHFSQDEAADKPTGS